MNNHPVCSHSTRTELLLMTTIWTLTLSQRNRHVVQIQIILAQGEWPSAKVAGPILKDATQDSNKHSSIWWMFMSLDITSICFHGEELPRKFSPPSKIHGNNLAMKQMFDMSEKLIAEQSDELYGVNTINWEDSSWKHFSLIGDEEVISLSHAKVYVFSDSSLWLGKMKENPLKNHEDVVLPSHLQELYPSSERNWTDIVREDYSPIAYPVSKQLSTLLRPWSSTSRRRWSDWILEIKEVSSERSCAISTLVWWKVEEYSGKRRRS